MPESSAPAPVVVKAINAAKLLDCSRAHVYQLMERGHLRRIQIPGSKAIRIPIEDVYALVGQTVPSSGLLS